MAIPLMHPHKTFFMGSIINNGILLPPPAASERIRINKYTMSYGRIKWFAERIAMK